jgi:hypothetical protein
MTRCQSSPRERKDWATISALSKKQFYKYMEHQGYPASRPNPIDDIDEDTFFIQKVYRGGQSYDYVGFWLGDNINGGLCVSGTDQLVGGNSDGSFYIGLDMRAEYFDPE